MSFEEKAALERQYNLDLEDEQGEEEKVTREYSQEENIEDTRAAFLNWHKSDTEIKNILMKRGLDENNAKEIIETVRYDIKQEQKKKVLPAFATGLALVIVGFCLFFLLYDISIFSFLPIIIGLFFLRESYINFKRFRI